MRIERVADAAAVAAGAELFDGPPLPAATDRFMSNPGHHLLFAYGDDEQVLGMVSAVETTHPDKGTEMFLYELAVAEAAQGRGVGTALVLALATLTRERGCYGMWVGVDLENEAALATYRKAGAASEGAFVMLSWSFRPDTAPDPTG